MDHCWQTRPVARSADHQLTIETKAEERMSGPIEYCHHCGAAIAESSTFCSNCGAALAEPEPAAPAYSTPASGRSPAPPAAQPPQSSGAPRPPSVPVAQTPPPSGAPPSGTPPPRTTSPPGEPAKSSRNWVPVAAIGGVVLVIAGIVVALLLALGGSAGKDVKSTAVTREQALQLLAANGTTTVSRAAPGLFAVVQTRGLSAIVPAGWRATAQAANGATRAEFADPKQPSSTLTIVAQKGAGGNDAKRALAARRRVKSKGYTENAFGRIAFPGGRAAWQLTYTNALATHETFFYSACNGRDAMVVDVSASSNAFPREHATLGVAAAGAEPQC